LKKLKKTFKRNNSGQLLIVAALAIAILISSTTTYVYELTRESSGTNTSSITDFVLAMKQTTRNVVISSLANVSNSGVNTILTENLNLFSQVLRNMHQLGINNLEFTVRNVSGYDEGSQLSWGASGVGVSSASANFTLQVYAETANITVEYAVNITTVVTVSGSYVALVGNAKNVSLTCNIKNEGQPALVKSLAVFYNDAGNWTQVGAANNLSIVDHGNGTYAVSFTIADEDPVQVSVQVLDLRNIFACANVTCFEA
jgi:hypothetical protein